MHHTPARSRGPYEEYGEATAEIGPEVDLLGPEAAAEAAETLEPGSCALMLLVEHVRAARAADVIRGAGGRIAGTVRIPSDLVEEARRARREAVAAAAAGRDRPCSRGDAPSCERSSGPSARSCRTAPSGSSPRPRGKPPDTGP
ncbi:hypothetical protein [Streptomyces sp. NK15101]|uniref:hypothetical protein n=1 Tax=Streptomyces sp. NK15101 TaxID=2873261 RepID=UPI001CEC871A|nr:hypothetical protein [Streptomyces sp. NK15101]